MVMIVWAMCCIYFSEEEKEGKKEKRRRKKRKIIREVSARVFHYAVLFGARPGVAVKRRGRLSQYIQASVNSPPKY